MWIKFPNNANSMVNKIGTNSADNGPVTTIYGLTITNGPEKK